MKPMRTVFLSLVLVGPVIGLPPYVGGVAEAQGPPGLQITPPVDVYAAKFLCGTLLPGAAATEGPVKPGNYLTAINVHNPHGRVAVFQKKALLLFRADIPSTQSETPMPPGPLFTVDLKPDWGLEIDCDDIRNVLLGAAHIPPQVFIKGFVVIEIAGSIVPPPAKVLPPLALDVVPAYTAHGFVGDTGTIRPEGFSLAVERVTPNRKVF